jgi:hypothetical protein
LNQYNKPPSAVLMMSFLAFAGILLLSSLKQVKVRSEVLYKNGKQRVFIRPEGSRSLYIPKTQRKWNPICLKYTMPLRKLCNDWERENEFSSK